MLENLLAMCNCLNLSLNLRFKIQFLSLIAFQELRSNMWLPDGPVQIKLPVMMKIFSIRQCYFRE